MVNTHVVLIGSLGLSVSLCRENLDYEQPNFLESLLGLVLTTLIRGRIHFCWGIYFVLRVLVTTILGNQFLHDGSLWLLSIVATGSNGQKHVNNSDHCSIGKAGRTSSSAWISCYAGRLESEGRGPRCGKTKPAFYPGMDDGLQINHH